MKPKKNRILLFILLAISGAGNAQKKQFDIISYISPQDWKLTQYETGIQLSITDSKTGSYAMALITKATASAAGSAENFSAGWKNFVTPTVKVSSELIMQEAVKQNDWTIVSGGANYTDGANTGMATLLNASGNGQTVSVILMTNSKKYEKELTVFINSLELAKATAQAPQTNTTPTTKHTAGASAVVGLWCSYILETTGYYINNMPQYTSGYLRKEYAFYPDGTYLFRNKQWLTKAPHITYMYESGTYTVSGNQLTLTPNQSKAGFWSKTSNTKEWGKLVKLSEYKEEKTTYTFSMINDATYGNSIVLKPVKPTQRDGGNFNAADDSYEFSYKKRDAPGSLIDNPPGVKTGFENKPWPK